MDAVQHFLWLRQVDYCQHAYVLLVYIGLLDVTHADKTWCVALACTYTVVCIFDVDSDTIGVSQTIRTYVAIHACGDVEGLVVRREHQLVYLHNVLLLLRIRTDNVQIVRCHETTHRLITSH